MPAESWLVVVDASGSVVSEGTVVADPLPEGMTVVEVDGPSDGRPWDPDAQAWGSAPEPAPDPAPAVGVVLPVLAGIAADTTKTLDQKIAAIVEALADSAS